MVRNEGLWKIPVGAAAPFVVALVLAIILEDADLRIMILYYGLIFASLCACISILLSRLRLSTEKESSNQVLSQLARSLRVSRFTVKEGKGYLSVPINSTAAVKIRTKSVKGATIVSYSADATPAGWTIWFVLLISGYGAFLVLPVALYLFLKARSMAIEHVLPRLPSTGAMPKPTAELGISEILVDSLSEARRIAREAYDGAKSNYEDEVILTLIASGMLFGALSIGLYFALSSIEIQNLITYELAVSLVASSVFCYGLLHRLRRTRRPRIEEFRIWDGRLNRALDLEVSALGRREDEPSALELLVEASSEMPKWMKARVEGSIYLEPGTWMLIVGFSIFAFSGAVAVLTAWDYRPAIALGVGLLTTGVVGSTLIYLRWRKGVREEQARFSREWETRLSALKLDAQRILEEM